MITKEILPGQLKKYISSAKSANLMPDGCRILPRVGRVTFDLSDFNDVASCKFRTRRLSGNGKVIVKTGGTEKNITIASKTSYVFNIPLGEDKKVEIIRPGDGTGEVSVMTISFDSDSVEEPKVSINWKDLIGKCGKYGCLRLIKGRLYASAGGFIEKGDLVRHIDTSPANAYRRDGKKLVFPHGCEITNLVLSDVPPRAAQARQLFVERQPPPKLAVAESTAPPPPAVPKSATTKLPALAKPLIDGTLNGLDQQIVFDSNSLDLTKAVPGKNKYIKAIKSLGKKYLVVKSQGSLSIPISSLNPKGEYICVVYAKSLNGNGRMRVGLSSNDTYYGDIKTLQFDGNIKSKFIALQSDSGKSGGPQRLHLMRPSEVCTGEVLINRIVIIDNIEIKKKSRIVDSLSYVSADKMERPNIPGSSIGFNLKINNHEGDQHYVSIKKYARYYESNRSVQADPFFDGGVAITSTSGMEWFYKMKSFYPKIWLDKKDNQKGLSISQSGSVHKKDQIWMDAYDHLPAKDYKLLAEAKTVFSPSLSNCQDLEENLPEHIKVRLLRKPLPWIVPKEVPFFSKFNYVVAFDRCPASTSRLVAAWNTHLPPLVLLGARGSYPDHVIPTNEYLKYDEMIYILNQATSVIDLPQVVDYQSSFLNLLSVMGKPVVSTNWDALSYSNAIFMAHDDLEKGVYLPTIQNLKQSVKDSWKLPVKAGDLKAYNEQQMEVFKSMFG